MKTITISDETYNQLKGDIERLEEKKNLLEPVASMEVRATLKYKVSDCFKGKEIHYRDSYLDYYLTPTMPTVGGGTFTAYKWENPMTFKEMVQAFLNTKEESLDVLAKLLIAGGHTFSLKQIEEIIKLTDEGKETGLRTDGWSNFFPVHDTRGNLFFVDAFRRSDGWYVSVRHFGHGSRWHVEDRVLFCN